MSILGYILMSLLLITAYILYLAIIIIIIILILLAYNKGDAAVTLCISLNSLTSR